MGLVRSGGAGSHLVQHAVPVVVALIIFIVVLLISRAFTFAKKVISAAENVSVISAADDRKGCIQSALLMCAHSSAVLMSSNYKYGQRC